MVLEAAIKQLTAISGYARADFCSFVHLCQQKFHLHIHVLMSVCVCVQWIIPL